MTKTKRSLSTTVAMAWAVMATAACLDYTPITLAPEEAEAGPAADAHAEGAVSLKDRCLSCAAGGDAGGCPGEYAACFASPTCQSAIQCVTGMCLESLATITSCLTACEADAGVSDPSSAGSAPYSALFQCMSSRCESSCIQ